MKRRIQKVLRNCNTLKNFWLEFLKKLSISKKYDTIILEYCLEHSF